MHVRQLPFPRSSVLRVVVAHPLGSVFRRDAARLPRPLPNSPNLKQAVVLCEERTQVLEITGDT
jgi:hypothetical protein